MTAARFRDCNYSRRPAIAIAIAWVVCPGLTEGEVNPVSFKLEEINNRDTVVAF